MVLSRKRGYCRIFVAALRGPSRYSPIQVFSSIYSSDVRKGLGSMYLLEDPLLASKKYRFNYPKMGLIKLLLPICPPCLDYLQERSKHDLDRHFIHKSIGKCDIIMQNCRLIILPHLSFARPEQNKEKKNYTTNVITPLSQVTRLH